MRDTKLLHHYYLPKIDFAVLEETQDTRYKVLSQRRIQLIINVVIVVDKIISRCSQNTCVYQSSRGTFIFKAFLESLSLEEDIFRMRVQSLNSPFKIFIYFIVCI